jgi:uncharacterized protein
MVPVCTLPVPSLFPHPRRGLSGTINGMPATSRSRYAVHCAFGWIADLVWRRPVAVLAVVLLASGILAGLATQAETVDAGQVENETSDVLRQLDEEFGGQQSVLQIILTTDGDVRGLPALRATGSIEDAIRSSDLAGTLATAAAQPEIVSFLDGVAAADPADDADVRAARQQALAQSPPQLRGLLEGLISDGDPPRSGLMLVFQDTAGLTEQEALAQQRALAALVRDVPVPEQVTVEPFGFTLMLADQDLGPEIGRLFGTALAVILLVLAVVYWLRPEAGQKLRIGRRTAADVGLTLVVIVLAVVWMQGIGVLLGPDYLDLIGYFTPQTDIVPILLIGLGVDFAIHLLARYRDEVGASGDPGYGYRRAATTIGVTLAVATGATAIGFLTNLTSPVDFLRTLGVLAAVGITAAFVLTLTFLPAMRLLLDRRAARLGRLPQAALATQSRRGLPRTAGRTAWLAERAPVPTLAVALALAVAGGYGFTQLDTRFEFTDFVSTDEPLLATYERLVDQFGGGFEETTSVRLAGDLTRPQVEPALAESLRRAAGIDAVELLRDQQVRETLGRVVWQTDAGLAGAVALADDLREAFAPVRELGVEVTPVSQEIAQAEVTEAIEDTQLRSLATALLAAMALLVGYFWMTERRPLLGVVTLLPVGLVLAWTFGMMAVVGIPLNPVTATLAALSIGIAVPFTLHVTSRFVEERRAGDGAVPALRRTAWRTGGALAGSALTTAIGFGVLVTSTLVPFEQLGYVIVFVIVFSLVAAVLVLPSLLVLADRWGNATRRPGSQAPSPGPA